MPKILIIGVVAVILTVTVVSRVIKRIKLGDSKVDMLLAALRNKDSSQRFPESGKYRDIHAKLNEISGIIGEYQREIARSEKFNEIVLDVAATGIIVCDSRGFVVKCNRCALQLTGLEVLTHLSQLPAPVKRAIETSHTGEPVSVDSGNGVLTLTVTELMMNDRTLRVFALNDVDRVVNREEVGTWSRLTRVLTHEIMNSLSPITSISETLLATHPDDSHMMREGLCTIRDMSIGLESFVESYRDVTRPVTPVPIPFDVFPFLKTLLRSVSSSAVTIDLLECPPDLMLYADQTLITRVVHNLLLNAVQAAESQPDGRVGVRASLGGGEKVIIDIINNGPQIPPEIARNIFTPFFTTKVGGTGVGLSISRQIMTASGGSIHLLPYASSASPTVFRLIFD